MRLPGIERLERTGNTLVGRPENKGHRRHCLIEVVLALGDERRFQSPGAVMVGVIERNANVLVGGVHGVPMDDGPSRVRRVQMLNRKQRQRQHCRDCTHRDADSEGFAPEHESSVYRARWAGCQLGRRSM